MRLRFKYLQTDGAPLTADIMNDVQTAYEIFDVIGDIAGNLTILSGCEVTGTDVAPGIVAINGDVLYFEGGNIYQTVFIHQEDIYKVFKNQVSKVLIEKRTVKFGDDVTTYQWADFVRIDTLKKIKEDLAKKADKTAFDLLVKRVEKVELKTAPIVNGGVVFIWNLPVSQIPAGWKECTDLKGKTVFGLDPDNPQFANLGMAIGSSTVNIQKTNLPNITIGYEDVEPGNPDWGGGGYDGGNTKFRRAQKQTSPLGSGTPLNILNPGRIVNFIEPNFQ